MGSETREMAELAALPENAMLTEEEAATYLRVKRHTLKRKRWNGTGPRYVKLGQRSITYRKRQLDEWIESMSRSSTSDQGEEDGSTSSA